MLFALTTTFFCGCEKEGVYKPKKKVYKICKIYDNSAPKCQYWEWDGDLVKSAVSTLVPTCYNQPFTVTITSRKPKVLNRSVSLATPKSVALSSRPSRTASSRRRFMALFSTFVT